MSLGTLWSAMGFIDVQSTVTQECAIQSDNRILGVRRIGHVHEAEPTRLPRVTVLYDVHAIDGAVRCEQLAHVVFTGVEVQVSNKHLLAVSSFRLRARLDVSIPSAFSGQRGCEPRFLDMAPLI